MERLIPGTAMTKLRIEFNPPELIKAALAKFTDEGDIAALHVYAGAERIVPTELLHRNRPHGSSYIEEDEKLRAKIHRVETYLANTAEKYLFLNEDAQLGVSISGNGRLLMSPSRPQKLKKLTALFDEYLPGEINSGNNLDAFVYVDFSSQCLTKDVQQRRAALENFKARAADPSKQAGFHLDDPHLTKFDFTVPLISSPPIRRRAS